jgi:hypothetical protein
MKETTLISFTTSDNLNVLGAGIPYKFKLLKPIHDVTEVQLDYCGMKGVTGYVGGDSLYLKVTQCGNEIMSSGSSYSFVLPLELDANDNLKFNGNDFDQIERFNERTLQYMDVLVCSQDGTVLDVSGINCLFVFRVTHN